MDMKNTKAIFLIVLGSFIIATGFAFAVESQIYTGASSGNVFQDGRSASVMPSVNLNKGAEVPVVKAAAPAPEAPKPEPTFGEKMKKFLGKNGETILMVGAGAYLGIALLGGMMGALTGGLFIFALMYMATL